MFHNLVHCLFLKKTYHPLPKIKVTLSRKSDTTFTVVSRFFNNAYPYIALPLPSTENAY